MVPLAPLPVDADDARAGCAGAVHIAGRDGSRACENWQGRLPCGCDGDVCRHAVLHGGCGMMRVAVLGLMGLSACTAPQIDPARAADRCEERARAAQGPTGSVTFGANSNTGPFTRPRSASRPTICAGLIPMRSMIAVSLN